MVLYNVTVNVDDSIHQEWLDWMKNVHIPEVLQTGLFVDNKIFRILSRQEDETGFTYSIQYFCESMEKYEQYQKEHAPRLQASHSQKYEGKFYAFRSLLELV